MSFTEPDFLEAVLVHMLRIVRPNFISHKYLVTNQSVMDTKTRCAEDRCLICGQLLDSSHYRSSYRCLFSYCCSENLSYSAILPSSGQVISFPWISLRRLELFDLRGLGGERLNEEPRKFINRRSYVDSILKCHVTSLPAHL